MYLLAFIAGASFGFVVLALLKASHDSCPCECKCCEHKEAHRD